jgi:hypothetical protein
VAAVSFPRCKSALATAVITHILSYTSCPTFQRILLWLCEIKLQKQCKFVLTGKNADDQSSVQGGHFVAMLVWTAEGSEANETEYDRWVDLPDTSAILSIYTVGWIGQLDHRLCNKVSNCVLRNSVHIVNSGPLKRIMFTKKNGNNIERSRSS